MTNKNDKDTDFMDVWDGESIMDGSEATPGKDLFAEAELLADSNIIDKCLTKIDTKLQTEFGKSSKTMLEFIADKDTILENHIDYLRGNVGIRCSSLKIELERIEEEYCKELDRIKKLAEPHLANLVAEKEIYEQTYTAQLHEIMLNKPHTNTSTSALLEKKFAEINKNLEILSAKFSNMFSIASFEPSESSFCDDIVGRVTSELLCGENLRFRVAKLVDFAGAFSASSFCIVNDRIYVVDKKCSKIVVYNMAHQVIERHSDINGMKFAKLNTICSDSIANFFITNADNNEIIITDLAFKKIKVVISCCTTMDASVGLITDIRYQNGLLYVLDSRIGAIHTYNLTGAFVLKFTLDLPSNPPLTKNVKTFDVDGDIIAVVCYETQNLYVYNLKGELLTIKDMVSTGHILQICIKRNYIFVHTADKFLVCLKYTSDDKELVEIFSREIAILNEPSSAMVYHDGCLRILLQYAKQFCVID